MKFIIKTINYLKVLQNCGAKFDYFPLKPVQL